MKKVLLIVLSFISVALTISLVYSFIRIQKLNENNNQLLKEINDCEEKIEQEKNSKVNLEQEYEALKTNNNELLEYEKWNKWTKEIEQKMF